MAQSTARSANRQQHEFDPFFPYQPPITASDFGNVPAGAGPFPQLPALAQGDVPPPSWNHGRAKQSILDFVAIVTRQGSPGFVPVPDRIATFDNDGTLWCEKPVPVQGVFALDRIKALAPEHPEWRELPPFLERSLD